MKLINFRITKSIFIPLLVIFMSITLTSKIDAAQVTLDAQNTDGVITSSHTSSFTSVRTGSSLSANTSGTSGNIGSHNVFGSTTCGSAECGWEYFVSFDTSSIPSGSTINSVTFRMYGNLNSGLAPNYAVYARDWGTSVTTADWVAGDSISGLTNVANISSFTQGAYRNFTSNSNFLSAIVAGGTTRLMVVGTQFRDNVIDSNGNGYYASIYTGDNASNKPQITVDYTPPSSLATLTTPPTSSLLTDTTVRLSGNVTSDGGATITSRGICYALTATDSTPGFTTATGSTPESGVTCPTASGTTGAYNVDVTSLTPNSSYSFRSFARNSVGNAYSAASGTFTTYGPPSVTTNSASGITSTQASLNSTVNPNGTSTNISYLWGTQVGVACNLQPNTLPGPSGLTGTNNVSPNATTLGSLSSNTTYYFCVMATNTYGTTYGTVLNFDSLTSNPSSYGYMDAGSALGSGATDCDDATGAPCPPSLNSIGSATQTSLTANWTAWAASAGPQPTSYNLFYCDRTSNGSCTPNIQIGGSISSGATSYAHNSGITCGRNYAYILRAVNAIGSSSDSTVRTGSTSSCASAPSVTTSAASGQTTTTAILNSTINPNNDTTSITYRWQTGSTATCNGSTPTNTLAGPSGLTGGNPLSGATTQQTLTGLTAGTRYYYCATATNSISPFTTYGTVQNFWTLPNAPTSPSATKQGNGLQINVNYSNVTGATGYNIYACSGASCTPTFLTSYGGTTYQHTGLSCGTTYRYQVAATNSAGEGAKTSIFSATTTSGGTLTCYQDTDTDGYAPAGASTTTMCGSCSSGYTSTQPTTGGANGNIDCYDGNGSARPNNPSAGCGIYYGTRGDGSGDYDCNGTTSICGGGNSCNSTFQFYQSGDFGCTSPVTLCSSLGGSATQCGQTTWGSTQGYCGYGYVPTCGSLTCTYSGAPLQGQLSCY